MILVFKYVIVYYFIHVSNSLSKRYDKHIITWMQTSCKKTQRKQKNKQKTLLCIVPDKVEKL